MPPDDLPTLPSTHRRLFVYGTLMPGQPRWRDLAPFSESTVAAFAKGSLWDTGLGYPGATFGDPGGEVPAGEIPGVVVTLRADNPARTIARLDAIEDEGVLYRRVEIDTSEGRAMTYEWVGETSRLTPLLDGWS